MNYILRGLKKIYSIADTKWLLIANFPHVILINKKNAWFILDYK